MLVSAGRTLVILVGGWVLARHVVPRIMQLVLRTRSKELMLMTVLGLCFAIALGTASLGLSLALGAFLAGLLLSGSEYSLNVLEGILPSRTSSPACSSSPWGLFIWSGNPPGSASSPPSPKRSRSRQYPGRADLLRGLCLPHSHRPGRPAVPAPGHQPGLIFSTVTRDLLPPYVGGLIYCACWPRW